MPKERRRFALLNIPRHLFSEATASTARRAANRRPTVDSEFFTARDSLVGTDRDLAPPLIDFPPNC